MRDRVLLDADRTTRSDALDIVKDVLMDARFNIDSYDRGSGTLTARRNDLTLILLGLYRRVKVTLGPASNRITLDWGGGLAASAVSFLQGMLVSLFFFRREGIDDVLASILIGLFMALINMLLFVYLRFRLVRKIKRSLKGGA
ncbi:MAG: hypothetical protein QCI82_11140 [Candidatus Thermoplasmatota archaeon]|nr:hypothetical protein [Candidatus Thermoplasmatota archaeon]